MSRGVAQSGSSPSLRSVTQTRSSLLLFGNARLRMTLLVLNSSTLEPFSSFKGLARIGLAAFVAGVVNSVSTPPLRSLAQLDLAPLTCGTACLDSPSAVSDFATFEAPPSLRGASCSEFSPAAEACLLNKNTCLPTLGCSWACVCLKKHRHCTSRQGFLMFGLFVMSKLLMHTKTSAAPHGGPWSRVLPRLLFVVDVSRRESNLMCAFGVDASAAPQTPEVLACGSCSREDQVGPQTLDMWKERA